MSYTQLTLEERYQISGGGFNWQEHPDWKGQIPDIRRIAEADATAVGRVLFNIDSQDTAAPPNNAAWSGTLLFTMLGSDQSGRLASTGPVGIIDTLNDMRDVLFAYQSYKIGMEVARDHALDQPLVDVPILGVTVWSFINNTDFDNLYLHIALPTGTNPVVNDAFEMIDRIGANHVLDMLRSAYAGQPLADTNGQTFADHAHTFFSALGNDAQTIDLRRLDNYDAATLTGLAKGADDLGLATRNALKSLSAFALTGLDYSGRNASGELSLYDPTTGTGELTTQWLTDRAEFLWAKAHTEAENVVHVPGLLRTLYEQKGGAGSTQHVYEIGKDSASLALPVRIIAFGDDVAADILSGDVKDDHLYGGGGADTLAGKGGNDYLEGGRGDDTYVYAVGDGLDTIDDSDGLGRITVGGVALTLAGGAKLGADTWLSADKQHQFALGPVDAAGQRDLFISGAPQAAGAVSLVVKHFIDGALGLALPPTAPPLPAAPTPSQEILGDLAPVDFEPAQAGVQTRTDALGNIVTDPNKPEPGRADALYGGAGNEHLAGLAGADRLDGKGGGRHS